MKALFSDPAKARRLGEAGRARVVREFSREVMGAAIRNLYAEIRDGPRPAGAGEGRQRPRG